MLAGHPFRITLSSDALVSKDTFFGRTTCVQDLEVDIPSDKNHINQHRDSFIHGDLFQHRGEGEGKSQMSLVKLQVKDNQRKRESKGWMKTAEMMPRLASYVPEWKRLNPY